MNKLFTVSVAALGLGLGLFGCGLINPESPNVDVTIGAIPAINGAASQAVTGTIEANVEITSVTPTIKDSSGAAVTTITVSRNNYTADTKKKLDLKDDLAFALVVSSATCNGTYTLELTAVAGAANKTTSTTFTVSGVKNCGAIIPTGTPVVSATLEAGSQGNASLGSSIDLDAGVAYKMADATAKLSSIDLCYATTGDSINKIGSPSWAKASGFNYTTNWPDPSPTIKFYKPGLTQAQFEAIKTKEEIPTFVDASAITSSPVAAGDVYIVKTSENATVLVLINTVVGLRAGSITVKSAK
jgi:hypothetical protein